MSIIQTQVKKQLTFEQICPKWSQMIKSNLKERPHGIAIYSPAHCIVGEAYGFSDRYVSGEYRCEQCRDMSMKLADEWSYVFNHIPFNEINEFVDHWNACHV